VTATAQGPTVAEIHASIQDICKGFDLDYWERMDRDVRFPLEFWRALGDAGLHGILVPRERGGLGLGMRALVAAIEETARGGVGQSGALFFVLSPVFGSLPISRYGTEEQQGTYLPGLATGEHEFSMALTEPEAGSNSLRITTTATRDGDDWVVSGRKIWISGVERARAMLLVARTSPYDRANPRHGITLFLLDHPASAKGLTFTPMNKLALRVVHSHRLTFDNVRIPGGNVLGEVDNGLGILFDVLNPERIAGAAGALGHTDLCIRLAVERARGRAPFGKPIGAYQSIAFPLARLSAELEGARMLTYHAADTYDRGEPAVVETTNAKLVAAPVSERAAEHAFHVYGGMAFEREQHVERLLRDAKLNRTAPVTEELSLAHIAQHVLGLPRSV
jgi:acyl-CoA dehydrogenase